MVYQRKYDKYDLCLTVHHQCRQSNIEKTNLMQQITVFIDLQDQLNMFRAIVCQSSGALGLQITACGMVSCCSGRLPLS
jgi:hypothetical protein